MQYENRFDLYPRKSKGGKKFWYYRIYDEEGNRSSGKSTRRTNKIAARDYVIDLIKRGSLQISIRVNPTFEEYSKDWWVWDKCEYIRRKLVRGRSISPAYADSMRTYLTKHVLPYFESKKLQKITPAMIEKWIMALREKPSRQGSFLSTITINHCLRVLKIMLQEAVRLEYLPRNPAKLVEPLSENPKERSTLRMDEAREIFLEENFNKVWEGDHRHYTLNLLSASTGMRLGEVQALRIEKVHRDYVSVHWRWNKKYGLGPPKRNSYRDIPIPTKTSLHLQEVIESSPYKEVEDFVFFGENRYTPVPGEEIRRILYNAFKKIGISREERRERNVNFHSWRYFYNSIMRGKIHDSKLQRLTGHRTEEMTDHYTRFNISDFQDVLAIQEEYFG